MNIVPQDFVTVAGNDVRTESRTVARHFSMEHRNVLRSIRAVMRDLSAEDRLLNFAQTVGYRANPSGGKPIKSTIVEMTKNGFMWLVMGFTGKQAMRIKVAYTKAFDAMTAHIQAQAATAWRKFDTAYLEYLSDKRHASACGKGLRIWREEKPAHLSILSSLDPQLAIPFGGVL